MNSPNRTPTCKECHTGVMRLRRAVYLKPVGRDYITVPHFPAWICDVCGYCAYDERSLQWLDLVLGGDRAAASAKLKKPAPPSRARTEHNASTLDS
ncbi:MAG: YgiT-type zinc finger protein [Anaerolineales bacterium]|nr:YgiT-type zinc finger protein [Anaerolineales bacterium]